MEGRRTNGTPSRTDSRVEGSESVTALAEAYGVSRKTIYKWLGRHESEGTAGLADRSRAPHNSPLKVSAEMIAHIIETRQHWGWGRANCSSKWPRLGRRKDPIGQHGGRRYARQRPESCAQAPATDATLRGAICGCCAMQPNLVRGLQRLVPHEGWTRCDPLTITDAYSRFLLCCQIAVKADTVHVEALFDAAFREYGLPEVIHTDNGAPFASRAPGGLSRLSMRWFG